MRKEIIVLNVKRGVKGIFLKIIFNITLITEIMPRVMFLRSNIGYRIMRENE